MRVITFHPFVITSLPTLPSTPIVSLTPLQTPEAYQRTDLYKQDIQRVKAMGVNTFSFSISWPRIFPFGTADSPVNQEGVQFVSILPSNCRVVQTNNADKVQ